MAIITLEELKTHLKITGSSLDTELQSVVDVANKYVETYCDRIFEETEYEEILDGTGTNALILTHRPVTEITSIYTYDEEVLEREDNLSDGYYYKNLDTGLIFNVCPWPRCRGCIVATYSAGYSDENMPADLKFATLEVASFYYNTKGKAGILQESLGSYSYRLATGLDTMGGELAIPSINVRIILDKYKDHYFSDLVY